MPFVTQAAYYLLTAASFVRIAARTKRQGLFDPVDLTRNTSQTRYFAPTRASYFDLKASITLVKMTLYKFQVC